MYARTSLYLIFSFLIIFSFSCGKDKGESLVNQKPLPEYIILDKVKLLNGNIYADILIKSYSKNTPVDERESTVKVISQKENINEISLYSTENAKKANFSSSFSKKHPNALKNGYLGSYKNGIFTPGEKLYP